jgi:hypothetical protein
MTRSLRFRAPWLAPLILMAVLTPVVLGGQEAAATLSGRVTDSSGRGLSGVVVTAQSAVLLKALTARTTATGDYSFATLPAGPYVIGFAQSGFVTVKRTLRLASGETAVAHVVLRNQRAAEDAITVSADPASFSPASSLSLVTRYAALDILPVTGTARSAVALMTDLPRPDLSRFAIDGLHLRNFWFDHSFSGPGPESLQEVTVTPRSLPARYGSLQTGAIDAVTNPGYQRLSGSVRGVFDGADMNADSLREARKLDGLGRSMEYTLGGPLLDRAWFFASGRHLTQSIDDRTRLTDVSFASETREHFGTAKLTFAPSARHRLTGQWIGIRQALDGAPPAGAWPIGDTGALESSTVSDRVFSAAYAGRPMDRLDVVVRYAREAGKSGSESMRGDSLIERTAFIDQQTGAQWWAPGTCASCEGAREVHDVFRASASTIASSRFGSHSLSAGVDLGRHDLTPAGVPAGGAFEIRTTRALAGDGTAFPVASPGGSTWIVWTPGQEQLRMRGDAFYVADHWIPADRVSLDLGLRIDRQSATRALDGRELSRSRTISPRLTAAWRPSDRMPWTVHAGVGRYVSDVTDRRFDLSLSTRQETRAFLYGGPSINTGGSLVAPADALSQILSWLQSRGGVSQISSIAAPAAEAGGESQNPIRVDEWSFGVSRPLGTEGHARADFTIRSYGDLPGRVIERGSTTIDALGQPVDTALAVSTDLLERRYAGLTLAAKYRFGHYADVDARYTLSRLTGNLDDRQVGDALAMSALGYPEYFDPDWHVPTGALAEDARHRLRFFGRSELMANDKHGMIVVTLIHSRESGRPYGAAGLVGVRPYVTNPGYLQPPVAVLYHFTARDAFRTKPMSRTDLGVNYRRRLPGTVHGDLFVALHVLNLMGKTQVLQPQRLVVTRTAFTDPALQAFNPFVDTPVQGTHWSFDDSNVDRDTARPGVATTMPRAFRVTVGIRF